MPEAGARQLMLRFVQAQGYRSLRRIGFPADQLSVFVGANGVGKTNLYRALQLLQAAATGRLAHELAAEGGMDSAFWAGPRRAGQPVRIELAAEFSPGPEFATELSYSVALGLTSMAAPDAFELEPLVKEEKLGFHHRGRVVALLDRRGPAVFARDTEGKRGEVTADLLGSETALAAIGAPQRYPEVHFLRETLRDWRFYHDLRTDVASALRRPALAVTSPTLESDGANLAAVFATLRHIRQDTVELDTAVADAFPGARLEIPAPGRTASFGMVFTDHPRRVFEAAELSDGTLRFLALAGGLLALRLPRFIALNEPESSLHPDLLEPLARLIHAASSRTQIWLVTHSERLATALQEIAGVRPLRVIKRDGASWIEGLKEWGRFAEED